MGKKKYRGICCICGEEKDLTFEHIPPRAAFNRFQTKVYDPLGYILERISTYTSFQKGVGKYTLCESCNNLTGAWYGAAYADFAHQGMSYHRAKAQGVVSVPYTIYPLRVFKQVISCFASTNGPDWCCKNSAIRDFLLDPYERRFPNEIDIRMYMQASPRTKISEPYAISDTTGDGRLYGSEWGYPPFSYICVMDKNFTTHRALNGLYSIIPFLKYGYDDQVLLHLRIPRKPCNPIMLDFREGVPDIETFIRMHKNK